VEVAVTHERKEEARVHGRSIFGQNLEHFMNRVDFGWEPATQQPNAASDPLQNLVAFAISMATALCYGQLSDLTHRPEMAFKHSFMQRRLLSANQEG
jgi:hypothetical protein